jgi:hypothetical protein
MTRFTKWLQGRREAREMKAAQSGDSPERKAEQTRGGGEPSVEEAAQRASIGLTGNSAPFQG